ncbi:sulfonate ABC transporter substrate-binding protein [Crenobacter sp. SG2305]|uniref:sulfonate ABC transporter substrate-binding protein n=1 Tax=Crenobacter oryzisoli TaxID=3056844 RepID=UPI0025AB4B13|nr:sulfonate ABC transporter substrate-binding protein [Crenobacter sp. SG2305]MDN0082321.1 sulfonate ABC transporter substrate-binding protein [Crenobacter sp. SG2305]
MTLLKTLLIGALAFAGATASAEELSIGYQKSSVNLVVLKSRGLLEQRLKPLGVTVKWTEFAAGPPILEALNVGSVNFGMTGDTPPVFAQAAGTNLVYVGFEAAKPQGSAILVAKDSPLKTLADLKGKRVAFTKGSSAHYLVLRALKKAGLTIKDIQPAYLQPADARAAFERGNVDAWAVWDPFYAVAERTNTARVLSDGRGLSNNFSFYLASRQFADQNPKVIAAVIDELSKNDAFLTAKPKEVADILARYSGQDVGIFETMLARHPRFQVAPLTPVVIADQQRVASSFHEQGLIPRAVKVQDIVWRR